MLDQLATLNPWWTSRAAIAQDQHLLLRAQAPVRWVPRVATEMDLSIPAIYTLRGPRQVGKTTALKLMIERSLREAPDEGVLYFTFDYITDPDAVRAVVQNARRLRPEEVRWRIFLDEISSVPNWARAVKWLWDNTPARHDTFVVTGSSAIDIEAGAERMPGRRGAAPRLDRILLPLSFADFARLHNLNPPAELRPAEFFEATARRMLVEASLHLPVLQTLLDRYLRVGGFPAAVAEEATTGAVTDQTLRLIWELVESEVTKHNRDAVRAYRTLEHTVRSLGQRTTWTKLGRTLDTKYHAAEDYARLLAKAFALLILYKYELHRGGPQIAAEKKLYLADPLLAYIPRRIRHVGLAPERSALVENQVIMGLFRSEERPLAEQFALPQGLFYWRSGSGAEIDALVGDGPINARVPVEVKYQATITGRDLAAMHRSFQRGILVTMDSLDVDHPPFLRIPAVLFLWVLGGEHVAPQVG